MSVESIEKKYPLHWLVWNNSYEELQQKLKNEAVNNFNKKKIFRGYSDNAFFIGKFPIFYPIAFVMMRVYCKWRIKSVINVYVSE